MPSTPEPGSVNSDPFCLRTDVLARTKRVTSKGLGLRRRFTFRRSGREVVIIFLSGSGVCLRSSQERPLLPVIIII